MVRMVYLPSCVSVEAGHMYEAMDLLYQHAAEVEKTVFFHTANLFNLEVDLIFYDTTTASFSVDFEDDPESHDNATLRKFGHSKEGNLDPAGGRSLGRDPGRHPGSKLGVARQHHRCQHGGGGSQRSAGLELGRAMFVADSGMNSEDNPHRACQSPPANTCWPAGWQT